MSKVLTIATTLTFLITSGCYLFHDYFNNSTKEIIEIIVGFSIISSIPVIFGYVLSIHVLKTPGKRKIIFNSFILIFNSILIVFGVGLSLLITLVETELFPSVLFISTGIYVHYNSIINYRKIKNTELYVYDDILDNVME